MLSRIFTLVGSLFYLLWAALHVQAGNAVTKLAHATPHSMVQARLYQDAWTLYLAAGLIALISLAAIFFQWRPAYWLTLAIAFVTDVGFIIFVLVPHYMPLWPGLQGPLAWAGGLLFTTIGLILTSPDKAHKSASGRAEFALAERVGG
jgi:fatty acid desaturase